MRFSRWKLAWIIGVVVIGALLTLPNMLPASVLNNLPGFLPHNRVVLGLDLQGGSSLLLEVDTGAIVKERVENLVNDLRAALRSARIGYRGLGTQAERATFSLTDRAQAGAARDAIEPLNPVPAAGPFGGATVRDWEVSESGGRFTLSLSAPARAALAQAAIEQSIEIVRRRIDELGTREASIQRQGGERILVQVPGERDPENIKRLLGRTARLTFHMVDLDGSVQDALEGRVPTGSLLVQSDESEGGQPYLVERKVEVSGENLVDAQPSFQDNEPVVSFRFDNAGARAFARITQENVGRPFAIVLDDRVISAPNIREPILGGSGVISGNFTVESANELAVLLRSGALPAPLTIVEERTVGAELGADSIRAGALASVLAGILVMAFMFLYYGVLGAIANAALIVNLVLVIGVMSMLGATLTLPGIAGIVLTIGQAVDSNVLIYERIREEQRIGRKPLGAIATGFDEALRTIIDANVTTLIAGLALFAYGTGPVKGFAVTLCIGIITTMFTAVTFTRLLVNLWYGRTRPAVLPL